MTPNCIAACCGGLTIVHIAWDGHAVCGMSLMQIGTFAEPETRSEFKRGVGMRLE